MDDEIELYMVELEGVPRPTHYIEMSGIEEDAPAAAQELDAGEDDDDGDLWQDPAAPQ